MSHNQNAKDKTPTRTKRNKKNGSPNSFTRTDQKYDKGISTAPASQSTKDTVSKSEGTPSTYASNNISGGKTAGHDISIPQASSISKQNNANSSQPSHIHHLANNWLQHLGKLIKSQVAPTIIIDIISSILFLILTDYVSATILKFVFLLLFVCIVIITLIALIFTQRSKFFIGSNFPLRKMKWFLQLRILFMVISITILLLSSGFLSIVLIRPPGCPVTLCSTTQDEPVKVNLFDVQSSWYVISGHPTSYLQNLSSKTPRAQRMDKIQSPPYAIVFDVQNLQHLQKNILIEQISLVIDQISPMPRPLNVLATNSTFSYPPPPFLAIYNGQDPGKTIVASSTSTPPSYIDLKPQETNQIGVQIISRVRADIKFHVTITYRIPGDMQPHYLSLTHDEVEVVFSDASNWHTYLLQDGIFVAQP